MVLYDIKNVTEETIRLGEICNQCCEQVRHAVLLLNLMDNGIDIMKICQEIDRLESEADRVMRSAMSWLFREEADVRVLIKPKAIYELLEQVTDRCEDVANIIEGIVLETPDRPTVMENLNIGLGVVVFLVALALAFDFMNGFHDAANAIATIVSTRITTADRRFTGGFFYRDGSFRLSTEGGDDNRQRHHRPVNH